MINLNSTSPAGRYPRRTGLLPLLLAAVTLWSPVACRSSNPPAEATSAAAPVTPAPVEIPATPPPPPAAAQPQLPAIPSYTSKPINRVTGGAVMKLTREFLAVAPKRFNGSPGHAAAEAFIRAQFAPEDQQHQFEVDSFSASTPAGLQSMRNLIVRFPSANPAKKDGIIVLATHYETNFSLKDINFVGANDGACTTALLIEIGHFLRTHPPQGYSVWLVFDDGEEAVREWSDSDSLYGTRHLAAKWSQDGTIARIKAFLVADMLGDKSLDIDDDGNSTPALRDLLKVAAKNTSHSNALSHESVPMQDDHLPFAKRGVPVLDLIDYNYGPMDEHSGDHAFHHTVQDTVDKLSEQSLQTSADLLLEMINLVSQH